MASNIINFDGELFFNRHGLNEIGISPEDSEAIYTYLLTQHKMHDGITGYIFINSVINVRLQRSVFNRLKLLEPEPLTLKRFFDLSWEFLRDVTGGYTYIPMKLCGFFRILAPYKIGNNSFSELDPLNNVYVNGQKVGAPFSFLILEGDLITEPSSGVTLLNKPITPDSETFKRIEKELFFFDPDIVTAAKYQITGFDPIKVELPPTKKFKKGEPIDNANPPEKQLIASNKYRDRPSPKALEIMLAAVTDLIKKNHPTDYPTDDVIIESVIQLHPKGVGKGLSQTKMKQGLSNGRGHLGIKNPNNSKK